MILTLTGLLVSATGCGGASKKDTTGVSASSSPPAAVSPGGQAAKPPSGRTYKVVLELLGKGTVSGVDYHAATDGRAQHITLPWKKAVTLPGGVEVQMLASAVPPQKVTCAIVVNGKVRVRQGGQVPECQYRLPK